MRSIRRSIMDLSFSFKELPREKTFEEVRNDSLAAYQNELRDLRRSVVINFLVIFLVLIVGMVVMSNIEGWDNAISFYWAVVTLMTVGYGDYYPTFRGGKIFTIFYCLIGCSILAKGMIWL
jgi:hypothetical protein